MTNREPENIGPHNPEESAATNPHSAGQPQHSASNSAANNPTDSWQHAAKEHPQALTSHAPTAHTAAYATAPQASLGAGSHSSGAAQHPETQQQWWNTAAPEQAAPRPQKVVGLKSAVAMVVAASVLTGGITGAVLNYNSSDEATSYNALYQEPATSNVSDAEAGSVEAVAAAVLPSVVSIQVVTPTAADSGSGSIISSDGYVLTNNHVVSGAADSRSQLTVTMNDGTSYDAEFIAGDSDTDVAVIKILNVDNLPAINFGNSDDLTVGQPLVAIGSPLGLDSTVTTGIVSALNRAVRASGSQAGESSLIDAIQTDAAINPGNSGGPLVDMNGNLIGMNSMIASTSYSGESSGSIGLGFAIPSNFAQRVAQQLIETGEVTYPMIGVQVQSNSQVIGALIAGVESGSAGEQAGLQQGDIITAVNDRRIDNADSLIAAIRSADFGETITLTVTDSNGDNQREVQVTLPQE